MQINSSATNSAHCIKHTHTFTHAAWTSMPAPPKAAACRRRINNRKHPVCIKPIPNKSIECEKTFLSFSRSMPSYGECDAHSASFSRTNTGFIIFAFYHCIMSWIFVASTKAANHIFRGWNSVSKRVHINTYIIIHHSLYHNIRGRLNSLFFKRHWKQFLFLRIIN